MREKQRENKKSKVVSTSLLLLECRENPIYNENNKEKLNLLKWQKTSFLLDI